MRVRICTFSTTASQLFCRLFIHTNIPCQAGAFIRRVTRNRTIIVVIQMFAMIASIYFLIVIFILSAFFADIFIPFAIMYIDFIPIKPTDKFVIMSAKKHFNYSYHFVGSSSPNNTNRIKHSRIELTIIR